jgi:hypothetical protein
MAANNRKRPAPGVGVGLDVEEGARPPAPKRRETGTVGPSGRPIMAGAVGEVVNVSPDARPGSPVSLLAWLAGRETAEREAACISLSGRGRT